MDSIELGQLIARLRRAQPRNADLQTLCDECDRLLIQRKQPVNDSVNSVNEPARKDMAAYMRAYREKKKAST